MLEPQVPKSFLEELKKVNPGLFPIWNSAIERFQIFFNDKRNGLTRVIMTVQNDDDSFRPCDMRTILFLANNVDWQLIGLYPEPKDMGEFFLKKWDRKKQKADDDRKDYLNWFVNNNMTAWKAAIENMKRGITSLPEERERKIIVHARG